MKLSKEARDAVEKLGPWFEFKVIEHEGETFIAAAQWYLWTGADWKAISVTQVPMAIRDKGGRPWLHG